MRLLASDAHTRRQRVIFVGLSVVALLLVLRFLGVVFQGRPASVPAAPSRARPARAVPQLFAPDSLWNRPLGRDTPIDPRSGSLVANLRQEIARELRAGTGPWINTRSYSVPIYVVSASAPGVPVKLDDPLPPARRGLQRAFRSVPIPSGARPAPGTDAHMVVYQPATDRLWEFWRARREGDGWHASWGGAIAAVSGDPGYYTPAAWPGATRNWGASASSLSIAGGTIRISELKRRRIDHALAIALPFPRAGVYSLPAERTDGTDPSADAIPEGARLRLDPALDLRRLDLPPVTRAIAEAAQRYGLVVRDRTLHAIAFYGEDPQPTGGDPYPVIFGGEYPNTLLARFPWARLQLVQMRLRPVGRDRPAGLG